MLVLYPRMHKNNSAKSCGAMNARWFWLRILGFSTIVQQSTMALWRMRTKRVFVGLGAPAGPVRNDEVAVFNLGQVSEKLVIPCQPGDIRLHDSQVRYRRAEVGVHHGAEVAVKIMRCDVDLKRLGGRSDLHRLPHAVPWRIDDRDIDSLFAEIGQKFAQT